MEMLLILALLAGRVQDKRPLEQALERGLAPGGDLDAEIDKLGESPVRSRGDARAIVKALAAFPASPRRLAELERLARLFQEADEEAIEVLHKEGLPELARLFDAFEAGVSSKEAGDLMGVLAVLASAKGQDTLGRVVRAARNPILSESYEWESIFGDLATHRKVLIERLRSPIPPGFAGIAYLDVANDAATEGNLKKHPFDSKEGRERLRELVARGGSYGASAVAAIPYIGSPDQYRLIALARAHAEPEIRIDGAWAMAKIGREEGVRALAEHCKEMLHSLRAQERLEELGRDDAIPREVRAPEFAAKADFAQWLAHPNELGRAPDALEVVDTRVLRWPGAEESKKYWLIRYSLMEEDGSEDTGVGIVGTSSWCSFWDEYVRMAPEDVYGAYAERDLAEDIDFPDEGQLAAVVARWRGPRLEKVRIRKVCKVRGPGREAEELVGIAEAARGGKEGWAVFDGATSAFYLKEEFLEDFWYGHVLAAHIGRRALGLENPVDRAKWARRPAPKVATPEGIIRAFEKSIAGVRKGTETRISPAVSRFSNDFHEYAKTLGMLGRGAELRPVLELLEDRWKDEWGGSYHLGRAAAAAGLADHALPRLEAFFREEKYPGRGEDACVLARLLVGAGRRDDARAALLKALRSARDEAKTATHLSDVWSRDEDYQNFRREFFKHFPAADLEKEGLPPDLVPAAITVPEK